MSKRTNTPVISKIKNSTKATLQAKMMRPAIGVRLGGATCSAFPLGIGQRVLSTTHATNTWVRSPACKLPQIKAPACAWEWSTAEACASAGGLPWSTREVVCDGRLTQKLRERSANQ
jgi:hypothetical protein